MIHSGKSCDNIRQIENIPLRQLKRLNVGYIECFLAQKSIRCSHSCKISSLDYEMLSKPKGLNDKIPKTERSKSKRSLAGSVQHWLLWP